MHAKHPGDRVGQFLPKVVGKVIAAPLLLLYTVFWTGGAAANAVVFAHYVSSTVLVATPLSVLVGSTAVIIAMVSLCGLKTLVRLSDSLLFLILPISIFMWVGPVFSHRLDLTNLIPFRIEEVAANPLMLAMMTIGMYHGYLMALITGPVMNPRGRTTLVASIAGTLAAVPAFFTFVCYPVLVLGWPMAEDLTYPAASFMEVVAPKTLNIPVRRVDFILAMLLRFVMVIAAFSYFYSAAQTITDLVSPARSSPHPWAVLALTAIIVASPFVFKDMYMLMQSLQVWMVLSAAIVGITIILAIVAMARGSGGRGRSPR